MVSPKQNTAISVNGFDLKHVVMNLATLAQVFSWNAELEWLVKHIAPSFFSLSLGPPPTMLGLRSLNHPALKSLLIKARPTACFLTHLAAS